jgi:hypothetical protein
MKNNSDTSNPVRDNAAKGNQATNETISMMASSTPSTTISSITSAKTLRPEQPQQGLSNA